MIRRRGRKYPIAFEKITAAKAPTTPSAVYANSSSGRTNAVTGMRNSASDPRNQRMHAKGIPHWLDIWGDHTAHDWPFWLRMAEKYF